MRKLLTLFSKSQQQDTRTPLERELDAALAERKNLRQQGWQRRKRA